MSAFSRTMSSPPSFDSVNDLADLSLSDNSDSLQRVMSGAFQADVRDGLIQGDANDQSTSSNDPNSSFAPSGGGSIPSSDVGDGAEAGGNASESYPSSSQSSQPSFPGNQEARWNQFYSRKTSRWHDVDPIAKERADKMASDLSDSAQKIHDGYMAQGMEKLDLPPVTDNSMELDEFPSPPFSSPFFITVPELVLSARSEFNRTFEVFGTTLDFVLTKRRADDFPWYIPPLENFADTINVLQNRILEKRFRFLDVLVETKSWCGVGIMSLKVTCPLRLARWREQLTRVDFEGYSYNSFPKDALLTRETQVSILLRAGLRFYDLKWLALGLKLRNSLKGKISVVYCKTYTRGDKTRNGICKMGWRLVIANVDQEFMDSYSKFAAGYGFRLGSSTVQIRPLMSSPEPVLPPLGVPPPPTSQHQIVKDLVQRRGLGHHGFQVSSQEVRLPPPSFSPPRDDDLVTGVTRVTLTVPPAKVPPKVPKFPLVPDLVKAISSPIPESQVRPKTGPGSRGGKGRKARIAKCAAAAVASAAAKKAYENACDAVLN